MSMRLQQCLISARFLTTFGHFIALLTLFSTIDEIINLGLPDNYSSKERDGAIQYAWSALIIAFFCFLFDFGGIFMGTTLFHHRAHALHIFFHFVGSVFLSWLITLQWNYKALWPIVASSNLPTALYEICILLGVNVFRVIAY